MKRFKEKTVIVTGAGSGMGRATALRFARRRAHRGAPPRRASGAAVRP